ncbi:MAG: hypothetical protein KUG61_00765 [Parvibaculaceae bacterium]|nr:hypothetical protein [Parvibaculaceae bacterium]
MTNHQFGTLNAGMMERRNAPDPSKEGSSLQSGVPLEQVLPEILHEQTPPPHPDGKAMIGQREPAEIAEMSVSSTRTPHTVQIQPSFGKRPEPQVPDAQPKVQIAKGQGRLHEDVPNISSRIAAFFMQEAVPIEDRAYFGGPERRKRDVSPEKERRHSRPSRVKLSLRVTPNDHDWLKRAAKSLGRTHQDILTVALNKYLKSLNVSSLREVECKISRK